MVFRRNFLVWKSLNTQTAISESDALRNEKKKMEQILWWRLFSPTSPESRREIFWTSWGSNYWMTLIIVAHLLYQLPNFGDASVWMCEKESCQGLLFISFESLLKTRHGWNSHCFNRHNKAFYLIKVLYVWIIDMLLFVGLKNLVSKLILVEQTQCTPSYHWCISNWHCPRTMLWQRVPLW